MPPEAIPPLTPQEMFKVWPNLWREQDDDTATTIELDTVDTKQLENIGAVAVAAVRPPQESQHKPQPSPETSKARHALRHIELGPFKIRRVVLPLAAVATGIAVAYFSPHSDTPAIAEKPHTSSSPQPSGTASPEKQPQPVESPSNIPFAISGYESSPSPTASQSWRYDGSAQKLVPSPNVSSSTSSGTAQNSEPKPHNSNTAEPQPQPSESIPSAHQTPVATPESPGDSTPPSVPLPSETTPQGDPSQTAPNDITPPQTPQSETSMSQPTETGAPATVNTAPQSASAQPSS